jgi:hypothetical protein
MKEIGKEEQGRDRKTAVEILKDLQNDPEAREEAKRIVNI